MKRVKLDGIHKLYESLHIPHTDHINLVHPSYAIGSTYRTDENTLHGVARAHEKVRFDAPVDVLSFKPQNINAGSVLGDFDDDANPKHRGVTRLKRGRRKYISG
jgi:hypothetical protein